MKQNWYGFKHKEVAKRFEGGLTYVTDFCVNDEYHPVAVYKVANPNRDKGHKDYVLLQADNGRLLIRGMDEEEIQKHCYQTAIECNKCKDVVYSVMRHDMRSCKCEAVAIDGGKDYAKISGNNQDYTVGTICHLTGEFTNENR
jgi:hypothetical protein